MASLSQGRIAAAQCGLFTHKSVPVIFEPPCICRVDWLVAENITSIPVTHYSFKRKCIRKWSCEDYIIHRGYDATLMGNHSRCYKGNIFLRNVVNRFTTDEDSYSRRNGSLFTPLWIIHIPHQRTNTTGNRSRQKATMQLYVINKFWMFRVENACEESRTDINFIKVIMPKIRSVNNFL